MSDAPPPPPPVPAFMRRPPPGRPQIAETQSNQNGKREAGAQQQQQQQQQSAPAGPPPAPPKPSAANAASTGFKLPTQFNATSQAAHAAAAIGDSSGNSSLASQVPVRPPPPVPPKSGGAATSPPVPPGPPPRLQTAPETDGNGAALPSPTSPFSPGQAQPQASPSNIVVRDTRARAAKIQRRTEEQYFRSCSCIVSAWWMLRIVLNTPSFCACVLVLSFQLTGGPNPSAVVESAAGDTESAPVDPALEKQQKRARIRTKVALEIESTEVSFVESLETLVKLYLQPLQAAAASGDPILSNEEINTLFSNIGTIAGLNRKFLIDLSGRLKNWDNETTQIGDVFLGFTPFFKVTPLTGGSEWFCLIAH
jgi:hypothetical protein